MSRAVYISSLLASINNITSTIDKNQYIELPYSTSTPPHNAAVSNTITIRSKRSHQTLIYFPHPKPQTLNSNPKQLTNSNIMVGAEPKNHSTSQPPREEKGYNYSGQSSTGATHHTQVHTDTPTHGTPTTQVIRNK